MVLKDGNKYACESCIRGHRVSGCNHTDRELHFIAPKGRPVKQCEHCRGARKSKSHHAKCDCGGKRERGETRLDDKECCCSLGDTCTCGAKPSGDSPIDGSHAKSCHARPHLTKNTSDGHLTTYINGRHKACHKWDVAHDHGVPYPLRKHSAGHGHSAVQKEKANNAASKVIRGRRGSVDDSAIFMSTSGMYGMPGQLSADNLLLSSLGPDSLNRNRRGEDGPHYFPTDASFDPQNGGLFPNGDMPEDFMNVFLPASSNTNLLPVPENPALYRSQADEVSDDADHSSFGSNDLPLNSNSLATTFPEPTSFSEESNPYSAPGLTAASSTTHSELGDRIPMLEIGAGNTVNASSLLLAPYDFQNMNVFDTSASRSPVEAPPAPTSNPSPGFLRRSLDVNTMRNLSSFPAFDDSIRNFLSVPQFSGDNGDAFEATDAMRQFDALATSFDTKAGFAQNAKQQMAMFSDTNASLPVPERPRSATTPSTYNPTSTVDAMYPQLDQDFANAASSWDPDIFREMTNAWLRPTQ